ncbi:MAG: hypothetical protein AB8G05_25995 [Oligoflexales bacterium]
MSQQTLEDLKSEFTNWRSQNRKRKPIPLHLRRKAIALLEHYSKIAICKNLSISSPMMDKWANPTQAKPKPKSKKKFKKEHEFYGMPAVEPISPTKIRVLDLTGSSGEKLRIEGEFTVNDITLITKAFMEARS